ncbi:MAG: histidine phosphatase family protein [Actinobacteria bacterium]|nr:histidine phosphatase family protein [Actinomycetota bacterium]
MTEILLVRHGVTQWNTNRVFRGRADIPLLDVGLAQARALARRLAPEAIDAVYTSPLSRAVCTAEILAAVHGLQPTVAEGLIDISYGEWEGQAEAKVRSEHPETYAAWQRDPRLVRPPGGESLSEVRLRAVEVLREISAARPSGRLVLVSHRVVNKMLLCAALGLQETAFWRLRQDTCCLNIIEWQPPATVVRLLNDTCHLAGLPPDATDF